jgi:hypothetical protein
MKNSVNENLNHKEEVYMRKVLLALVLTILLGLTASWALSHGGHGARGGHGWRSGGHGYYSGSCPYRGNAGPASDRGYRARFYEHRQNPNYNNRRPGNAYGGRHPGGAYQDPSQGTNR